MNKIRSYFKGLADILNGRGNAVNRFYTKTSEYIADKLSGNTATKSDHKFVYKYFSAFIVILLSILVFMNFYFLFYFGTAEHPNLTGWNQDDYHVIIKEYLTELLVGIPILSIICDIGIKAFISVVAFFHWLFPYLFRVYWGIGSHIVLPNMYFLINYLVGTIHKAIFPFFMSLLTIDFAKLYKNPFYPIVLLLCIIEIGKVLMNTGNEFSKSVTNVNLAAVSKMYRFWVSLFLFVCWLILMFIFSPPLALFACGCYFWYYSFVPLFFYGKGLFGNVSDIIHSLDNFNYEYIPQRDNKNCIPGVHPCQEHGTLGWIYEFLIEPSHIFFVRHIFTFIPVLFLLTLLIQAYLYIQSSQLKMSLVLVSLLSSILLVFGGNWFSPMTLQYPIHSDKRVAQEMGYLPLMGGLGFLFFCVITNLFLE